MDHAAQTVRVLVGSDPIDTEALVAEVGRPQSGATVLFVGTVSNRHKYQWEARREVFHGN